MKGDFSRDTLHRERGFTRVLMQQGRVQLDADFNEQAGLIVHELRGALADVIGPYGGPKHNQGFGIAKLPSKNDFTIGKGTYYVDGIRVTIHCDSTYTDQPFLTAAPLATDRRYVYFVYLEVWERYVSYVQEGAIRETALLGPDTCGRAQLVWQVKTCDMTDWAAEKGIELGPAKKRRPNEAPNEAERRPEKGEVEGLLARCTPGAPPTMAVHLVEPPDGCDPCIVAADARYRGLENQFYRIEIHRPGRASTKAPGKGKYKKMPAPTMEGGDCDDGPDGPTGATFKWSRENGSVVFPVCKVETDSKTTTVTVEHLGRDEKLGLQAGDWVELIDDDAELAGRAAPLLQVVSIDREALMVILDGSGDADPTKHALLRRWDQKQRKGQPPLVEGCVPLRFDEWIPIEAGIEIFFPSTVSQFATMQYWWFAARVATKTIEWPLESNGEPRELPPHGIKRHYAPLALVEIQPTGQPLDPFDARRVFAALAT